MITARYEKKTFTFKIPGGTSRGVLKEKHAWFIYLQEENSTFEAVGECSVIPGLSPDFDSFESYEAKVKQVVENVNYFSQNLDELKHFPSIFFGLEMAILNLNHKKKHVFFDTDFTNGLQKIKINGLIWMGSEEFMQKQIDEKLENGFNCIKMKIGAIDFDTEIKLIKSIRSKYSKDKIEIRVDANGAFSVEEAALKLKVLADLDLHSIEQPIKQGQAKEMQKLCAETKLPIALDEELIGITEFSDKQHLLKTIKPQYIILKPSLVGGVKGTSEWITIAQELGIPWWITSALESSIGLSAIAQFTSTYPNLMYQGLGTGSLYTNNIKSNLKVENGKIFTVIDREERGK